jgi:Calx-beta domain/Glycine rich protein
MSRRVSSLLSSAVLLIVGVVVLPPPVAAQEGSPTVETFSYAGEPQSFVVPDGVTELEVVACGAEGAGNESYEGSVGGMGGEARGTISVTPGEVLTVVVGGRGAIGGYNGGGSGHRFGGGASDVRQGGTGLLDRVLIGGGGGGSGFAGIDEVVGSFVGLAGGGGGEIGGTGEGRDDRFGGIAGAGGTATEGGRGGVGNREVGTAGTLGQGGQAPGGGGGGGGLFGGGGAGFSLDMFGGGYAGQRAGGGGGSGLGDSFVPASCAGDGRVTIAYTPVPSVPTVIPGTVTVSEGDTGSTIATVSVSLSSPSAVPVTVEWVTVDATAVAPADYLGGSGSVTFAPGETVAVVEITVEADGLHEIDELLLVSFRNPTNAIIGGIYGLGVVTILDDDPMPVAVPGVGLALEGGPLDTSIDIPVLLSASSGAPVTIDWITFDVTATSPVDYVAASGTLVIPPGERRGAVTVIVSGETTAEQSKMFGVRFLDARGAIPGGFYGLGAGVIVADD